MIGTHISQLLHQARHATEQKQLEDALAMYSKAIFINPDNPDLYLERAQVYLELYDFKSYSANIRKALTVDPSNKEVAVRLATMLDFQGLVHYRNGAYIVAVAYFTDALSLNALEASFLVHRALAHVQLQEYENALEDLDRYFTLAGPTADVVILQAKLQDKLGYADKAISGYKAAIALDRDHPQLLEYHNSVTKQTEEQQGKASHELLCEDFETAKNTLLDAVTENPNDIRSFVLLACACRNLGEYDEALRHLEAASKAHVAQTEQMNKIMLSVGDKATDNGATTGSEGKRAPVILEHPEIVRQSALIFNDMALREFGRKEYSSAILLLNRALAKAKMNAEIKEYQVSKEIVRTFFINRGDCYREMNKLRQALADYHSAFEINPHESFICTRMAIIRNMFGIVHFNKRDFEMAMSEFRQAVKLNDTVAEFHFNLGNVYAELGMLEEAFRSFRAALKHDPEHAAARSKLSQFETI